MLTPNYITSMQDFAFQIEILYKFRFLFKLSYRLAIYHVSGLTQEKKCCKMQIGVISYYAVINVKFFMIHLFK